MRGLTKKTSATLLLIRSTSPLRLSSMDVVFWRRLCACLSMESKILKKCINIFCPLSPWNRSKILETEFTMDNSIEVEIFFTRPHKRNYFFTIRPMLSTERNSNKQMAETFIGQFQVSTSTRKIQIFVATQLFVNKFRSFRFLTTNCIVRSTFLTMNTSGSEFLASNLATMETVLWPESSDL